MYIDLTAFIKLVLHFYFVIHIHSNVMLKEHSTYLFSIGS